MYVLVLSKVCSSSYDCHQHKEWQILNPPRSPDQQQFGEESFGAEVGCFEGYFGERIMPLVPRLVRVGRMGEMAGKKQHPYQRHAVFFQIPCRFSSTEKENAEGCLKYNSSLLVNSKQRWSTLLKVHELYC